MAGLMYRIGYMLRETGQALDRVGCVLQDNPAFREQFWRHRSLLNFVNVAPKLTGSVFVAPSATVAGDVTIGDKSSVWYGAMLRGDAGKISIGANSNVQDNAMITTKATSLGSRSGDTTIGSNVTIGHNALLHCATVEDGALVGIGAVLREGVLVQKGALVAAGAVVPPGTVVPAGQVWAGNPASYVRDVKAEEAEHMKTLPGHYAALAAEHGKANSRDVFEVVEEKVAGLAAA